MSRFLVAPASGVAGVVTVPGDKSISHRALMFAALALGEVLGNLALFKSATLGTEKVTAAWAPVAAACMPVASVMAVIAARPPRVAHLAVKGLPTSGKPEELMNAAGISARHIVAAAAKLVQSR